MKTLVYTTAFGEPYFIELAKEMFRSLRLRGYGGDAVLISDQIVRFSEELEVRVRVLLPSPEPGLAKMRLPDLMDVSGYDRVLFVDTDVVFLRDPAPLFALAETRVAVSRDHYPLRRNTFNLSFCDRAQRAAIAEDQRSVNTGVVVFPGARFRETLARWEQAWKIGFEEKSLQNRNAGYVELRDQPAFQKLLLEAPDRFRYIPDELLLMPLFFTENRPLHRDAVALHLNGSSRSSAQKQRLLSLMRDFNALEDFVDFRRVCDALQASRPRASFSRASLLREFERGEGPENIHANPLNQGALS